MKNILIIILLICTGISCSKKPPVPTEPFDNTYTIYASVLSSYIQDDKVDYQKLQTNRADLDSYINQLAGTSQKQLESMNHDEQMAYWINAYNGITLRSIIDAYPVKSIQDIKGVWKEKKWYVAEQEVSLDQIEHQILRPIFNDARVHFAVNNGSIGCPPLFHKPFRGENLQTEIEMVASNFVNNPKRHKIDFQKHTVETTEIFSWFWQDFVNNYNQFTFKNAADIENAVLNFTYQYLDNSNKAEFDTTTNWKVSFYRYDWSLNDIER